MEDEFECVSRRQKVRRDISYREHLFLWYSNEESDFGSDDCNRFLEGEQLRHCHGEIDCVYSSPNPTRERGRSNAACSRKLTLLIEICTPFCSIDGSKQSIIYDNRGPWPSPITLQNNLALMQSQLSRQNASLLAPGAEFIARKTAVRILICSITISSSDCALRSNGSRWNPTQGCRHQRKKMADVDSGRHTNPSPSSWSSQEEGFTGGKPALPQDNRGLEQCCSAAHIGILRTL